MQPLRPKASNHRGAGEEAANRSPYPALEAQCLQPQGGREHGAVQFNVGQIDEYGVYTEEFVTSPIDGFIRARGESDACLNRAMSLKDLLTFS